MKKLLSLILLLILICVNSVACESEEIPIYTGNTVIIATANDGISLGGGLYENLWSQEYFKSEEAKQFAECEFEGGKYSGEYYKSIVPMGSSYVIHWYRTTSGCEFALNAKTNKLDRINLLGTNEAYWGEAMRGELENPEDTAFEVARKIAEKYINIDEYEETISTRRKADQVVNGTTYPMGYYFVTYTKMVQGLPTTDSVSIKVFSTGRVGSIAFGDMNAFDEMTQEINMEEINADIKSALEYTYGASEKYSLVSYEITNQTLMLTPEGEFVITSNIQPTLDKEGALHTSLIRLSTRIK